MDSAAAIEHGSATGATVLNQIASAFLMPRRLRSWNTLTRQTLLQLRDALVLLAEDLVEARHSNTTRLPTQARSNNIRRIGNARLRRLLPRFHVLSLVAEDVRLGLQRLYFLDMLLVQLTLEVVSFGAPRDLFLIVLLDLILEFAHMIHPARLLIVNLVFFVHVGVFEDLRAQNLLVTLLVHEHLAASHGQRQVRLLFFRFLLVRIFSHLLQLFEALLVLFVFLLHLI